MKGFYLFIFLILNTFFAIGQCDLPETLTESITFTDNCIVGDGSIPHTTSRNNAYGGTYDIKVVSGETTTLDFTTLTINGTSLIRQVNVQVDAGGVLNIEGNFVKGSYVIITVSGTLNIDGNFLTPGASTFYDVITVGVNGKVIIGGDADFGGTTGVNNGEIIIKGELEGGQNIRGNDLPVSLTYFQSFIDNNQVALEWETASEQNASHFDVQRSRDNKTWETLGTVQASGNSQSSIFYEFIDESPLEVAYYRLFQVDLDGASEIFGPLHVNFGGVETGLNVVIMPNHITSGEQVQFNMSGLTVGSDLIIQVYNGQGHVVYSTDIEDVNSSALLKSMDFTDRLGTGMYYVVVKSGKNVVKEKLLVK